MTETQQKAKCITLKGSAALVKEYLRKFIDHLVFYSNVFTTVGWYLSGNHFSTDCFSVSVYGVNSILYQRGIYPPETFEPVEHFGLFVLMSTDAKIKGFLDTVLGQIQEWLVQRKVQKITLVITNVNTKEVLEKWDFKVDYEGQTSNGLNDSTNKALPDVGSKDTKIIQKEIREVIRQITGELLCSKFSILFVISF